MLYNIIVFSFFSIQVVITILAILGTIAFISLQGYSAQSRDGVRITDVSTMKTALELFHLDAGKYPLPENYETITYEGEPLWTQGKFGENTLKNVENLAKVPTDPLTDKQYIYSVSGNKNNFEILNLLEGELVLNNTLTQINAANSTRTAKVSGIYNGLYIKTATHIVPIPSLLTSEDTTGGMVLDSINIKSQIVNGGKNIPVVGNVESNTGGLDIKLSVYTGSITKLSTNQDKIDAMTAIQGAYTGSTLATSGIYKTILSKTIDEEKVVMTDMVILKKVSGSIVVSEELPNTFNMRIRIFGTHTSGNEMGRWGFSSSGIWLSGQNDSYLLGGENLNVTFRASNQSDSINPAGCIWAGDNTYGMDDIFSTENVGGNNYAYSVCNTFNSNIYNGNTDTNIWREYEFDYPSDIDGIRIANPSNNCDRGPKFLDVYKDGVLVKQINQTTTCGWTEFVF